MQRPWGRTMAGVVGGTARRLVRLEQSEQGTGGGQEGQGGDRHPGQGLVGCREDLNFWR